MENKTTNFSQDFKNKEINNKYSNERVKRYIQEYFEVEEGWKSPENDLIKERLNTTTLIEKYYCEDKYVDILQCFSKKNDYNSLRKCEVQIEILGKCIFERMKIESFKNY